MMIYKNVKKILKQNMIQLLKIALNQDQSLVNSISYHAFNTKTKQIILKCKIIIQSYLNNTAWALIILLLYIANQLIYVSRFIVIRLIVQISITFLVLNLQIILILKEIHYIVDGRTANVIESNKMKFSSIKNANMSTNIHVPGSMRYVNLKIIFANNNLIRDALILT